MVHELTQSSILDDTKHLAAPVAEKILQRSKDIGKNLSKLTRKYWSKFISWWRKQVWPSLVQAGKSLIQLIGKLIRKYPKESRIVLVSAGFLILVAIFLIFKK